MTIISIKFNNPVISGNNIFSNISICQTISTSIIILSGNIR